MLQFFFALASISEATRVSRTDKITIKTIDIGIKGVKESLEDISSFGFASNCELHIAQEFCHNGGGEHKFCANGLLATCERLREKCLGFEIDKCSDDIECCQCAFVGCPLGEEACNRISNECFYADFVSLQLEDEEITILRKLFSQFDHDKDSMLNYNETMALIAAAEKNTSVPTLPARNSNKISLSSHRSNSRIIINEKSMESTTVKSLDREDFTKMCVTVKENPAEGISLGTFLKVYAKHHGWFYRHIQRLVHNEQYLLKRREGCSSTARAKEDLDREIASKLQSDGIAASEGTHSKLANDPCDAEETLKKDSEEGFIVQDAIKVSTDEDSTKHSKDESAFGYITKFFEELISKL